MRSILTGSIVAIALAVAPSAAMAKAKKHHHAMHPMHKMAEKSLFERLGGKPAIDAVTDDFAGRVLADTRINAKFAKSDPTRLVTNLKAFMCSATGGPCAYTGQSMKAAHDHMGVTTGEFNALVEDLGASLDKFNVPAKEKGEVVAALAPLKPQIVEIKSPATGAPLPAAFKPAPAM
ncbi:group I truncated hemoglobin [Novosphingobium lentum]|uniref:group I truncated hemoglobin n=1 Tax=Novosphingobium lentum TaxID=145287 RepID=UPI000AF68AA3|nr:group 1 truncated hemoglobin [Novosphingobium lentum]